MSTLEDINTTTKKNVKQIKEPIQKVGKDHIKYIVLLKLLNTILANIGRDPIDDITKFVDVDRADIIKQDKVLEDMEAELFPLYSKRDCGYTRKTKNLVLNVLRGMMKETGYTLEYVRKDIPIIINGESYRKGHLLYKII